jgi:hypothetical protein
MEQTLINGLPGNDYARARAATQGKHRQKRGEHGFRASSVTLAQGTI